MKNDVIKAMRVLDSCKTPEHFIVAKNYIKLLKRKHDLSDYILGINQGMHYAQEKCYRNR